MKYQEPTPLSRDKAEALLGSGDPATICETLVSIAFFDPDLDWAQKKCLDFTWHSDTSVRCVAATCIGHLARIHGDVDLDLVLPRLKAMHSDPETAGYAETALSDIRMFVSRARKPVP